MEPIEYILFFIKVMVKALIGKAIDMLFKLFLSMALPINLEERSRTWTPWRRMWTLRRRLALYPSICELAQIHLNL